MPKLKVKAPVAGFTGTVCGVDFAKGEGTVDTDTQASAVHYFRRHGYEVAESRRGKAAANEKAE